MKQLFLLALFFTPLHSQENPSERIYNTLRSLHAGEKAAPSFSAKLTESSARRLLRDKIPGTNWYVAVDYNLYKGIGLKVLGSDNFYENSLSQHETYINEMLLPLLSTRGYERFKKSFVYSQPRGEILGVGFKKGDIQAGYYFQIGENGLVRRIDYYEDGVRKYALIVQWVEIGRFSAPKTVKAISYEGSRISGEFELSEIKIAEK